MADTWVFLRGLTRDAEHWGPFVPAFEARLPQARVIAIDLPGNGRLHHMRSPLSVRDMAVHVRGQLSGLGVELPVRLFAMSLGAMVAIEWAHACPHEVSHAVLVNTSLRGVSPFFRRLRRRSVLALMAASCRPQRHLRIEAAVLRATTHHAPPDTLARWIAIQQAKPVSTLNALRQLWAASRYEMAAARPVAELLVLASTHDALVDVRCSRAIARRWNVPLVEHPTAGHDLTVDDPAWAACQVADWLQRISS